MSDRTQDEIEAQRLADIAGETANRNGTTRNAGVAYIQSTIGQAAIQAVVTLLMHKGVITQAEFQSTLADSYRARADSLTDTGLIAQPAPVSKPNGSMQ